LVVYKYPQLDLGRRAVLKTDREEIWCDIILSIFLAQGKVLWVATVNGSELSV
jgi:hypothetical protein